MSTGVAANSTSVDGGAAVATCVTLLVVGALVAGFVSVAATVVAANEWVAEGCGAGVEVAPLHALSTRATAVTATVIIEICDFMNILPGFALFFTQGERENAASMARI